VGMPTGNVSENVLPLFSPELAPLNTDCYVAGSVCPAFTCRATAFYDACTVYIICV